MPVARVAPRHTPTRDAMHGSESPSPWVTRFGPLVPSGGVVLDVACGLGRHLKWFSERNHPVAGVDRSSDAIQSVASALPQAELRCADIEAGPWPYGGRNFAGVVVTHYLWRPLLPAIVAAVAEGGVLIYETFAAGNETVGKPSRPDFLLQPGELLRACAGLRIVAYEDGYLHAPARFIQRICAVREVRGSAGRILRLPLD